MSVTEDNKTHAASLKAAQTQMYDGRFDDALETLQSVLAEKPKLPDALYMSAVCHRYRGDAEQALAQLEKLKQAAPDLGRAWQEEGHLHRAQGNADAALEAYRRACDLNPALQASWAARAELLQARGETEAAAQALSQANRLARMPKELLSAANMIHEGKTLKAEKLCRHFLQNNPHHVEGMRLLADVGRRLGAFAEAEFLLESAHEFEPDNIQVHLDYIEMLRKRQKFEAARNEAETLYKRDPNNPVFVSTLAVATQFCGDFDRALALYDDVLDTLPRDISTWMSKGHALKTVGEQDGAIAAYRRAYEIKPDHGDAYWSLANLKTYDFTDEELARMRAQEESADIALADRYHLCFALGKACEDREDYETAFTYYERGNALKQQETRYDPDHMDEELKAQAAICTSGLFAAKADMGCPAPDPIFIVGLPRAGSTLLEQILASHSQVDGTMELPNILALAGRLKKRKRVTETSPYPRVLHDLDEKTLRELGEEYIEETKLHRKGAPFFTDKMPNNFRHIGLIQLILPNAKIIDARRHPLACCFSGFKQLFAEGQEFTYGLEEIGRYYRGYVELMDHWDDVLPGRILRVRYEDVVADLEGQVRRLLDYCGLPFEPACVDFHKTEREVRTASSEQVRRPLYKEGVEQWRHFEPWLDPLKDALGPVLAREDAAAAKAAKD